MKKVIMLLGFAMFSLATFAAENVNKTMDDGPEPGCKETKCECKVDCGYDSWYTVASVTTIKSCADGRLELYFWDQDPDVLCEPMDWWD